MQKRYYILTEICEFTTQTSNLALFGDLVIKGELEMSYKFMQIRLEP